MRWLAGLRERFSSILCKRRAEDELDDELRFHLEMQIQRNLDQGLPPHEARRKALSQFGGLEQVKEAVRDEREVRLVEDTIRDLRFALRTLAKNPGFAAIVIMTLALGIASTTAVFSVVHSVLLRPLPYEDPDRLMVIWERNLQRGIPVMHADRPDYLAWREQNSSFEEIGAFGPKSFFLSQSEEAHRIQSSRVTASLLRLLGIEPVIGRVFTEQEDQPGQGQVVILSHTLWRNRFGGDPDLIGRDILLNWQSYTVVGIMPAGFRFPPPLAEEDSSLEATELWVPLAMNMQDGRGAHFMTVIGRLRSGVTLEQAQADMDAIASRLERQFKNSVIIYLTQVRPL